MAESYLEIQGCNSGRASRVAQWSKALHRWRFWVRVQALSQPSATGRPMGRRTISPASSGVRARLAGREVLVPSCSSDLCGRPGACTLTRSPGVQCFLQHIGVADFGICGHCVKKQWGLAGSCFGGRTALDLRLSRVCTGVAAMRHNYQLYYQLDTQNWGEKG